MTIHQSTFRARKEVAQGTMAFHFEKPEGFTFKPGQAIDVILPDPSLSDAAGARRNVTDAEPRLELESVRLERPPLVVGAKGGDGDVQTRPELDRVEGVHALQAALEVVLDRDHLRDLSQVLKSWPNSGCCRAASPRSC